MAGPETIAASQATPTVKILHCIWTMAAGGAERQLVYLAGELVRRGEDVHVAIVQEGPLSADLASAGAVVHRLGSRSKYDPGVLVAMLALIRRLRPDCVQTWLTQMDLVGGSAASILAVPWILSERSSSAAYPPNLRHFLRRRVARRAAAVVCNSLGGTEYWRRIVREEKIARIPNGVPIDAITRAEPMSLSHSGRIGILFAGRLSLEKNPDAFLSAIEILASDSEVEGWLCGNGPQREQVLRRIEGNPILRRFIVPIEHEPRIWSAMKAAAAFVAPSWFEGHPNAVLEAMAAGTPLVVSDIPAHREFLDERSALLVSPGDPTGFASAVTRIIADPEAAAARAARAREIAARFSIPGVTDVWSQTYRSVIRNKGRIRRAGDLGPDASGGL